MTSIVHKQNEEQTTIFGLDETKKCCYILEKNQLMRISPESVDINP
jgi:hypothetical protein